MKSWRIFVARVFLAGFVVFSAGASCGWAQGMMGGEGMRGMMQNMMGDMLPPMNPAQLPDPDSKGALLLQQFCTQCHNLPGPGLHTAVQWPPVVDRMARRMRRMSGRGMMMGMSEVPTSDQVDAITDYLQKHSLRPFSERKSPELETPGGFAFKEVCSRCHALPDPEKHTGREWPVVVERMKGYMEAMGKAVPQEKELREIVRFLQRHGKRPSDKRQGAGDNAP
jgi:cytochrome c2